MTWAMQLRDDIAVKTLLAKTKDRLVEQQEGKYNFAAMRTEAWDLSSPQLDHASFIALVEVKDSPGKGRGLFLKKNVKAGDLVLCEKAVAYFASDALKEELLYHVDMDAKRVTKSNHGLLMQDLIQKLRRCPSVLKEVSQLASGDYKAPKMVVVDGEPVIDT